MGNPKPKPRDPNLPTFMMKRVVVSGVQDAYLKVTREYSRVRMVIGVVFLEGVRL